MKKSNLKLISLLLTISVILSCLSSVSFADTAGEGDFTVTKRVNADNEYWSEYIYTVKNNTSSAVSSVVLLIPTSGDMQKCETYGSQTLTYDAQAGGILLYAPVTITAGGSVELEKMGINPKTNPITIGDAKVYEINENKSWSSSHEYGEDSGSGSGSGTSSSSSKLDYELTGELKNIDFDDTPVGKHGKLHLATVEGYGNAPVIVDKEGRAFQLRGASTHGMHWDICTPFINEDAFHTLRDEWGVNLVRLVCYPRDYNGYTTNPQCAATLDNLIEKGMSYTSNLGMYAIIDWHVHQYNPNEDIEAAKAFFAKYAETYKDYDNVLYEICNEPTNTPWYTGNGNDIYTYANTIIPIIREHDDDAIIIVGTNTWSQDVDDVHNNPITGYDNIMYTLHFYSGSHGNDLRDKMETAINAGTPVFITEFGICDSSGNGNISTANADVWMDLCDKYNVSHACWSLSNKDEDASYFKSGCSTYSKWKENNLQDTGIWLVNTYRRKEAKENEGGQGGNSGSSSGSSSSDSSSSGSSSSDSSSSDSSSSDSSSSDSSSSDSSSSDSSSSDSSSAREGGDSSTVPPHSGDSSTGSSASSRSSSDSSSDTSKHSGDPDSSDTSKHSGDSGTSSSTSKSSSGSYSAPGSDSGNEGDTVIAPSETDRIKTKEYTVGTDAKNKVKVSYNAVLNYTGKNPVKDDFFKAVKVPVTIENKWSGYLIVKKIAFKNAKNAYVNGNPAYTSVTKKPTAVIVMALNESGKAFKKSDKEGGKELSAYLKSLNQAFKTDPIFFEIYPADLSKLAVTAKGYSRDKSKLSGVRASGPSLKMRGISQGKDFDISKDGFDEKEGSVVISGKGNYTGTKKVKIDKIK